LMSSGQFVQALEKRQGLKIACLEEIAFNQGFISRKDFILLSENASQSEYGNYLKMIAKEI
jgi:glucose-1-phosphate thymidylyltransferase